MPKPLRLAALPAILLATCAQSPPPAEHTGPPPGAAVTQGMAADAQLASTINECTQPTRFFEAFHGTVRDADGTAWPVPAPTHEGAFCADLHNSCTGSGANPNLEADLKTVVVDEDGEEITAYLHGDNYFELYVNGQYICRDPIAFVPFNSNAVRFRAKYPVTYAVRLVDWGQHLGVGMEYERYNVGDGGFAARFTDGTVTSAQWKCEVFSIAPVDDAACVTLNSDGGRDSTACAERPRCADDDPNTCRGVQFAVPDGWTSPEFDDSGWPSATEWSEQRVRPKPAFTDFPELFGDAKFIWSPNLDLDNQVLCRVTVEGPAAKESR